MPLGVLHRRHNYYDGMIQIAVQEACEEMDYAYSFASTDDLTVYEGYIFFPAVVFGKDEAIYTFETHGTSMGHALLYAYLGGRAAHQLEYEYEPAIKSEVDAFLRKLLPQDIR